MSAPNSSNVRNWSRLCDLKGRNQILIGIDHGGVYILAQLDDGVMEHNTPKMYMTANQAGDLAHTLEEAVSKLP